MLKKIFILIIFNFCVVYSQNNSSKKDVALLNEIISDLIGGKLNDTIRIYKTQLDFSVLDKKKFFSEVFFKDYAFPVIGVDNSKVKKLIKHIDFNYLSKQKKDFNEWDFSKLKPTVVQYNESTTNIFDKIRRYQIASPVFSEDEKTVFVYYTIVCGYIDCGYSGVKVYKKKCGKWIYYVQFPLTIS